MRPSDPENTGWGATRRGWPTRVRPLAPTWSGSVAANIQHSPSTKRSQPNGLPQHASRGAPVTGSSG